VAFKRIKGTPVYCFLIYDLYIYLSRDFLRFKENPRMATRAVPVARRARPLPSAVDQVDETGEYEK
jgi:hypothetical protein